MKTFKLCSHSEPEMAVTRFKWQTDLNNNVLISWTWPKSADVKYMLVAMTTENPDDPMAYLMQDPGNRTVVTRNLASHYQVPIGGEPKRFIFAPAYLQGKKIALYGPALATDLLYAKTHARVRITNRLYPFSPIKRVGFSIKYTDPHGEEIGKNALRYNLYEYGRLIGTYPLDDEILAGGYLFIHKTRHIRFTVKDEYTHLIALV
jgi:hypothetical protein